jgi:hypothetical protein
VHFANKRQITATPATPARVPAPAYADKLSSRFPCFRFEKTRHLRTGTQNHNVPNNGLGEKHVKKGKLHNCTRVRSPLAYTGTTAL